MKEVIPRKTSRHHYLSNCVVYRQEAAQVNECLTTIQRSGGG